MLHHFIKFLKDLAPYNGGMINIDGSKWLQLIKFKKIMSDLRNSAQHLNTK